MQDSEPCRKSAGFLVVGGSSGSRDVIYPSPKVGLLGGRPAGREDDATRGVAMSSRERHSKRTSCEDHESSVGPQFGRWEAI